MRQLCVSTSRYALALPGMRQLWYGLRALKLKHALAALALAVQVQ